MRYQGGKRRSAKFIAPWVARLRAAAPVPDVADLFLGSCGVEQAFAASGAPVTLGSEVCPAVVACYRAVAAGWEPPERLSREEYAAIRAAHGPDSQDPIAAFALLFCSYGGKWAAGHLPDDMRGEEGTSTRHASVKARKDLLALRPLLQRMRLECLDYREAAELVPDGGVLYLDPPWRGTEPYRQAPLFDLDAFWTWAAWASRRWRVLVSEGPNGPDGAAWGSVWRRKVPFPGLVGDKVECLWTHLDGLAAADLR